MSEEYTSDDPRASGERKEWKSPNVETVDLRKQARARVRDGINPKWHEFMEEHGYLVGRVPSERAAAPQWEPQPSAVVSIVTSGRANKGASK